MRKEARLALVNADAIAGPRVLLIGFGGPELAEGLLEHGHEVVSFHTDVRAAHAVVAPWLPGSEPFDAFVVALPREVERLRMWLAMARGSARAGADVFLTGHNDAGARSAGRHLTEAFGDATTVDTRFHCRLYRARVESPVAASLNDWRGEYQVDGLTIVSYPGVFAHGRLDAGTRMLLGTLEDLPDAGRALDVGCGAGPIAASLAAAGRSVVAADADALAVTATRQTLEANGLDAQVIVSDVYDSVEGRFGCIVSNPPFHAERRTVTGVAERIIREAPARLEPGGELRIVANRFLPYKPALRETFRDVDVVVEDSRYRVYRARAAV